MPASKKAAKTTSPKRPSGPDEISPGVFVGTWKDALTFQGARFCVLDSLPDDMPPAQHIPIYDRSEDVAIRENLDRLAKAIRTAHEDGRPVLVFCRFGIQRAPLGGAWYLHRVEGLSLDEAYDRVRSVRPRIEHAKDWIGNASELASE
jgi:hypothetical protein